MKVALGQIDIIYENKELNEQTCLRMIKAANNQNVKMLIFPEMTLTGFSMNNQKIVDQGKDLEFFKSQSKIFSLAIVFGHVIKKKDGYYNQLTIVENGQVILSYSKIHPFLQESNYYQKGNKIVNCKIAEFTVSPFICYDLRFPEIFQLASIKSQLIIVIASWPSIRNEHWVTLLKARAIENQCYFIGVNRIGSDLHNEYDGQSVIVDPWGKILNQLTNQEQLIIENIDIEYVTELQEEHPFKKDRRNNLYYSLYK